MSADLAQFLDGILRSFGLIAYAVALGGFVFVAAVLKPWRAVHAAPDPAAQSGLRLAGLAAATVALLIVLQLAAKAQFIAAGLKIPPFPEFFRTQVFQVNAACAVLSALAAVTIFWLGRRPGTAGRWLAAGIVLALLAATGAGLTHGSARLEQREFLMTITALHQTAGAIWAGSVVHLLLLWRLGRRDPEAAAFWPEALARFSALGIGALLVLFATGIPLTVIYVESLAGFVGSAYGSVLFAKWVLMTAALILAAANFQAARRWRATGETPKPFFAEIESILLVVVLFAASALAALPPAIDITEQRATFTEVVQTFAPRIPQMASPSLADEQAASDESIVVARQQESAKEQWSDYNHNMSGLILLAIAFAALFHRTGLTSWSRHWPLGFLALAAFVLFRSDPSGWPLAPGVTILQSFGKASWVQHRIAGCIPIVLGIMEWRARTVPGVSDSLRFALPVLSIAGGLLLLTHAHGAFELKAEYLTQVSHTAMGVFAVFMGCGRWLEIRMAGPLGRAAGIGGEVAMALLALILVFYREPLG